MAEDEIKDIIRRYIVSSFHVKGFKDDDDLFTTGFVHSVQAAEMVTFVEKTFSIVINREDRFHLRTLNDITEYVRRKSLRPTTKP